MNSNCVQLTGTTGGRYPLSKIEEMRERKRKCDSERYSRMLNAEGGDGRDEGGATEREREQRRNCSEGVHERRLQHLREKSKESLNPKSQPLKYKFGQKGGDVFCCAFLCI